VKSNVDANFRAGPVSQIVSSLLRISGTRSGFATAAITVGVMGILGAHPAFAAASSGADETSPDNQLQEVVVTAQFRQQSAQTTPIAITAVTGQQLDERSIASVTDLNGVAPNVNITAGTATNGPVAQIFIRGIGQSDGHPGLEPGVGLYVDDVYHGIMLGSEMDLTDLDRIEVLRGPQGTLSGKDSIGGAIKLYSKKPGDDTDGYVEAGYGSFNRINLRAGGNFTLVEDKLYVRVSGTSKTADGYMTRLDYGCVHPGSSSIFQGGLAGGCKLGTEGGQDLHAARVALRWIPNDSIENNLIGSVTADRSEVPALKLLYSNNTQKYPNGQPYIPGGGSQFITGPTSYTSYATYGVLGFTDPSIFAGIPGAGTHAAVSLPTTNPTNYYGITDTFTWQLAESYSLTAITGYLRYNGTFSSEIGDSPYPTQVLDDSWSERQFTEEIRLNGTSFGLLDWTAGGYYYDEHALFGGLKLLSPGLVSESLFTGNDPITSESKSGFLHGVFHATDALSVITGVRYTSESKDYTFQRLNPYDASLPSYNAVGLLNGTTGTYSGNHVDYRAGLEYQWTPAIMTYAQYSTGFRGGGVNPRPFIPQQEVPFKPETLRTAEIGLKSQWFDRSLLLNVAAFYSKYDNMLFTDSSPTVVNGVVLSALNLTPVNVGSSDIKGVEAELRWRPIGGLQIDGSASYLDFKLTSINQSAAAITGVTLNTQDPYAPSRMGSLGVQYTFAVGSWGSLVPRLDAQYQSSFYTDITNTPLGEVSSRTLMNAHLTWRSAKGAWESAIAVTNLTDRFYYINKINSVAPTFITQGQPGAPREWLMTVRRNF
jgi:iron complex outermembrane recepter protein